MNNRWLFGIVILIFAFSSTAETAATADITDESSVSSRQETQENTLDSDEENKESAEAPSGPVVNYGQIFMEEDRSAEHFPFGISVFGGQEISSPYISSYFTGGEVIYRIYPFFHLGLEYSVYDSAISSAMSALSKELELYGMEIGYPFLESTVYVNWHYPIFIGHVNLASFSKVNMDFPVQFGLGMMNMEEEKTLFAIKWGFGPRLYLTPRWGVQLLLSQIISLGETQFMYTYCSLNVIYNF